MDVLVSNMAWFNKSQLGDVETFLLKKKLTLIPKTVDFGPAKDKKDQPPKVVEMWRETATHLGVPRAYYFANLRKPSIVETFRVSNGSPLTPNTNNLVLRPDDQVPVLNTFLSAFKDEPFAGGLLDAWTGFGKTVYAIKMAEALGRSTAILVHKNPLKQQWIERINQHYPSAKVGVVQGPKCEFDGCDFVIFMAQSVMKNGGDKYPEKLWSYFGLVIVDECHRFAAASFSTVATRFTARFMIGLSATQYRADKCEDAFRWVIGQVLAKPEAKNQQKPIIYVRQTGFAAVRYEKKDPVTGKTKVFDMNDFEKPTLLNFIKVSKHRNKLIASDILFALKANRHPLVMSERLDILYSVCEFLKEMSSMHLDREITHGFYVGGKKQVELDEAATCDVVYTTLQLAKEGIDVIRLDTLFMVSPISDPTQPVGRIGRTKTIIGADGVAVVVPSKNRPMIVDYVDSEIHDFRSLYRSRLKFYTRSGFEIIGAK